MFFRHSFILSSFFVLSCVALLCFISLGFVAKAYAQPLNIYTYQSFNSHFGPGEALQQQFESTSDCKITWHESDDAVLLFNRLKMEGKHSQADVVLGLDTQLLTATKQANLVQPHHLAQPQNNRLNWWHDDFIPFDFGELTLIYDKTKVQNPPKTWAEFLNHPNWTLIYPDPRTSTPGLGFVLWIKAIYGDEAGKIWQKIAQKTVTVPSGWGDSYQLFLKGESDFVLSYNTSPIVHKLYENNDHYQAVAFEEGLYPQIELAAIAKNAPHLDCAKQFLAFLLTEPAQYTIATQNIMLPVTNIKLPEAFNDTQTQSNPFLDRLTITPELSAKWLKEWRNSVTQ